MPPASDIRKIAFPGDYLPRKCGIATFPSGQDLPSCQGAEPTLAQSKSDYATTFATLSLREVLSAME